MGSKPGGTTYVQIHLKARLHYKLVLKPAWLEPVPHVHTETGQQLLPEAYPSGGFIGTGSRWNQFQCGRTEPAPETDEISFSA